MATDEEQRILREAAAAFGRMFAVVTAQRRVLAAVPPPERVGPAEEGRPECFRAFFRRGSPCANCPLETALSRGTPALSAQARVGAAGGRKERPHHYVVPLPPGPDGPRLICTTLALPDAPAAAKRAELANAFVMNLIHGAADGVIATDMTGKLRIFNQAAADIFGYPVRQALAELHIRDLVDAPQSARDILEALRAADRGGRGRLVGHRVQGRHKDGGRIPISVNAAIVREGGQEMAIVAFFRDLREKQVPGEAPGRRCATVGNGAAISLGEMMAGIDRRFDLYDMRFGEAVVAAGLCTSERVAAAVAKQREIQDKTRVHVPIGRIMIQLGMITEEQRDAVLAMQTPTRASAPETGEDTGFETPAEPATPAAEGAAATVDDGVVVRVSDDRLQATLDLPAGTAGSISVDAVLARLAAAGVVYGVSSREAIAALLEGWKEGAEAPVVARGAPPRPASPPEVRFLFEADPLRIGTVREDGTTDWKDRGALPQVRKDDLLCELTPGDPGAPGTDVTGSRIPQPSAGGDPPTCGKGVVRSEDGLRYTAGQDGMVSLGADNVLTVDEALRVEGDIGLETGHVDFAGHVEVGGTVQKGYRVYAHSLRAEAVQEAELQIAGDVVVMRGVYDAQVKCRGTLKAGHVHKSRLEVGGDLVVEREIIDSEVETQGRCQIGGGRIVSSNVSAKGGIVARTVGSQAARSSNLVVGVDHRLQRQGRHLRQQIGVMDKERQRLESEKETLHRQAADGSERLGTRAMEQDRCMVQLRELETEIDAARAAGEDGRVKKMAKKQQYLLARKEQIDAAVDRLMAEEEERAIQIARIEEDLANVRRGIEELNDEMAELKETQQDGGRPSVKALGEIASGTTVTGPRANLTLREVRQRVTIFETDKPDAEGRRQWRFEFSRA